MISQVELTEAVHVSGVLHVSIHSALGDDLADGLVDGLGSGAYAALADDLAAALADGLADDLAAALADGLADALADGAHVYDGLVVLELVELGALELVELVVLELVELGALELVELGVLELVELGVLGLVELERQLVGGDGGEGVVRLELHHYLRVRRRLGQRLGLRRLLEWQLVGGDGGEGGVRLELHHDQRLRLGQRLPMLLEADDGDVDGDPVALELVELVAADGIVDDVPPLLPQIAQNLLLARFPLNSLTFLKK